MTKKAPDADKEVRAAFAPGDAPAGRAALNSADALEALGINDQEKVASMP